MIGMAYKDIEERVVINVEPNFEERFDIEEADFTLIGIIGIGDKVWDEVPKAIIDCKNAGIKVWMITGDNKHTALAIGKECGLIGSKIEKYTCMEG